MYKLRTILSIQEIAYTFRDTITRADRFLDRKVVKEWEWEFFTPPRRSTDDPFAEFKKEGDWTFAVSARFRMRHRTGVFHELLEAKAQGEILLEVWDRNTHRDARIVFITEHISAWSCARNFINAIKKLDSSVQVSEQPDSAD